MDRIKGIHHITAVAGNPQRNVDFYHALLGQRLVKMTVNFDDSGTYHFYFGDEIGSPGTLLTFFPWRNMPQGIRGNGEVAAISYSIPVDAIAYWRNRLTDHGVTVRDEVRFGAPVLVFEDPDGLTLELIAESERRPVRDWVTGPIPPEFALRGFYGVTIWVNDARRTTQLLTEIMGYERVTQDGNRYHFRASSEEPGTHVDLLEKPGLPFARLGAGSVHHVAFRTVDDEEQVEYQQAVAETGLRVTPVQDRQYFRSIYFREPGGVLFEIATDKPGFLIDETVGELGRTVRLPPWLEPNRRQIERSLPPITVPTIETEVLHDK